MSFRYYSGINKPGYNPFVAGTPIYAYNLFSWGQNTYGQLGVGNVTLYSSPKQVGALTDWAFIAQSPNATAQFAIKTDGTLWAWGYNASGELGLGNTTNYSSPKQVGALTNWSYVSAAANVAAAIKTDGTLWTWGSGSAANGRSSGTSVSSPVQVGLLTNWSSVKGGSYQFLALKTDGTMWAWGLNNYGQLGLGDTTTRSSPVQIGALTTWLYITAGYNSGLAVKTDNTLWSWGENAQGTLGQGNTTYLSSPKQIGALTNWSKVECGFLNCVSVKTDGTLWGWGYNNAGQVGDGTITVRSSPVQIGALTNWSLPSACYSASSLCIKTDGTLWVWGRGNEGELGLGNTTRYSSPKQVGSSTTWGSVGATSEAFFARG